MGIIKAIFLTTISTIIKVLSGVIINKFISLYIGPSGLAIIGQFQNISGIIQTVASAGLTNGVVKYTAENSSRNTLWSSALKITIALSALSAIILVLFSYSLSEFLLNNGKYYYIFVLFGFTIFFFSINQLLLAVISGLKRMRFYIVINIIQSLYSLVFTALLIYFFNLDGALIAMVTNQSIVFFLLLWLLRKDSDIKIEYFKERYDFDCGVKLLKFSLMTIVSVICLPVSSLIIRNYIGSHLSWDYAGYWQAINYISTMYLLVITTVLSVYYLPRLSSIFDKKSLIDEVIKNSIVLIPLTIFGAGFIFLLKDWIVVLLFSKNFENMLILLKYQLIGDVVKIAACLLSYLMLAKAMTKVFIYTEIFSAISLTLLSIYFLDNYGFIGLSYAYLINNIIYFCVILFIAIRYFLDGRNFMVSSI
ncbi:O-antigen translocase [Citrobacter europaeus]|uniref:O-antigen translocase n=1 Tax=Citrobacter europaeus TaxID=1914243 RepID=UPI000691F609|nr:O-antigen translocase [Citrobacter europaeus]AUT98574.1 O-antigen translocase [Citrobacter freundii]ROW33798.1 O-antigen translocase [Citrobacter europaeus]